MHINKNDQVLILSGNYKGRKGRVLKIFPETQRAIVEGVNLIKRHTKASQKNPQGGIVEKEASIHISNLMVICPKCNEATKVHRATHTDSVKGNKVRVRACKKCGEMLIKST
ncbi:50S ribosomal protein L24 [candidate division KSB1 bacterium]|nr:50S ribosomal protein L24 [candidate division KSB1 bacterium]